MDTSSGATFSIPTSTHYDLSDVVLNVAQDQLHREIHTSRTGVSSTLRRGNQSLDVPELDELRDFHINALKQASSDLDFVEGFFSLRLASNLSSHDRDPFVHVWTSLSDQGIGKVGMFLREKALYEERDPALALDRCYNPEKKPFPVAGESKEKFTRYAQVQAFLKDIDDKRKYIRDGTIQVPLTGFIKKDGTLVSDYSHFTVFFPETTTKDKAKYRDSKQFEFEPLYPADAAMHFQVHSNIGNSEGKMSYVLTGTGTVSIAEIAARVQQFKASNPTAGAEMDPIEIPLILNSISSQDPSARIIDHVEFHGERGPGSPADDNEALYEGSLFLYVHLADPDTNRFFGKDVTFHPITANDITSGNYPHVAAAMKMHVLRDMSPFINEFTSKLATVVETDASGRVIGKKGWTFDPSLPEGKNIHAPFNKLPMHTLPGFTYFHDRAMQRLPSAPFILNVANIVLARRGMSEADFVKYANNPIVVLSTPPDDLSAPGDIHEKARGEERYTVHPNYVKVLRIVGEISTAFATSMSYRGDYADMNTDAVDNYDRLITDPERFHHVEHASGMTRRSAGRKPYWNGKVTSSTWREDLKVGTEAFGDATIDDSGDCEDLNKVNNRMVAGMYSAKSPHPVILSIQSVLSRYLPFSNLSSVTSASIQTAPSDGGGGENSASERKKSSPMTIGSAVVGSRKDLNAPIGAHMFGSLLNKQEVLKAIQRTSSRIEQLPDGSQLDEAERTNISETVLHKSLWDPEEIRNSKSSDAIGTRSAARHKDSTPRETSVSTAIAGKACSRDLESGEVIDEKEAFLRAWSPPLILEGTGQSNALVNAISSYHTQLNDKMDSINRTLLHVEAVTRLISGMPSEQVTAESIKQSRHIFAPFTMPIENNRLVDSSPDVRISPFYRMITEMYGIPLGHTDERITPTELVRSQSLHHRKMYGNPSFIRRAIADKRLSTHGLDMDRETFDDVLHSGDAHISAKGPLFGEKRKDDSIYAIDRVIPVQLGPRILADEAKTVPETSPSDGNRRLTFGVNLTDFAHASDNVGIIRMVKTLPSEQHIINNVMRHAAPSVVLSLPPENEVAKAQRLAARYQGILEARLKGEGSMVTRERYEEIEDVPINLFIRTDWVTDKYITDLANELAKNYYVEHATVTAEPFARGHTLLRITPYMIVTGTKQLYLDSNTLAERLTAGMSESRMNAMLVEGLEDLLGQ